MSTKPILVTGSHRSGTTWVGRMIAASHGVVYIHEPFNINKPKPGICCAKFIYWFTCICTGNELNYYKPFRRLVNFRYNLLDQVKVSQKPSSVAHALIENARFIKHRLTGARPLIKDPLAFFSAEWLAANFDMEVVVMIRHPAAFASSIKSKNWKHPFDHFLKQPLLMERYLSPFASRIKKFAQEEQDIIDQAALLWIMIHSTILRYKEQYPEWIFVRHEDLSRDPMTGFEKLYDRLDLAYDEDASIVIKEHSSPSKEIGISHRKTYKNLERDSAANIWSWKTRLAPTEVQRIKAQVQEVSREFYSDDDW